MKSRWSRHGFFVDNAAEPVFGLQVGPALLKNTHPMDKCIGQPCCIHAPSDHHMRDWPMNWRADRRLMERICEHGVGHPDPDDVAWHENEGRPGQGIHGCDGCCSRYEVG